MPAVILLGIFSRLENWKRDLTSNDAKLNPKSADRSLRPLTMQYGPDDVAALIGQWAERQPLWSLESREKTAAGITVHLTRRTKLLRFTDDIYIRLSVEKNGTRIDANSQSRLGKADFGQNPRNLQELVSALREHR